MFIAIKNLLWEETKENLWRTPSDYSYVPMNYYIHISLVIIKKSKTNQNSDEILVIGEYQNKQMHISQDIHNGRK